MRTCVVKYDVLNCTKHLSKTPYFFLKASFYFTGTQSVLNYCLIYISAMNVLHTLPDEARADIFLLLSPLFLLQEFAAPFFPLSLRALTLKELSDALFMPAEYFLWISLGQEVSCPANLLQSTTFCPSTGSACERGVLSMDFGLWFRRVVGRLACWMAGVRVWNERKGEFASKSLLGRRGA